MNRYTEQQLLELTKKSLQSSAEQMDSRVTDRLRAARKQALSMRQSSPSWRLPGLPATALVMTVLVVALLWPGKDMTMNGEDIYLADEMLQTDENMELMQDLDFYYWLEEADRDGELA